MHAPKLPSPALVIAVMALFVSLSGTAVAAGIVPLAKRALSADKAKVADLAKVADSARVADSAKRADAAGDAATVGGKSAAQIVTEAAAQPGPAPNVGALVSQGTASFAINAESDGKWTIRCASGQRVISGGMEANGALIVLETHPAADGTGWSIGMLNLTKSTVTGTMHVVCVR